MKSMKVILSVRNLQILNLCLSVSVLLKYGSCCFGMAVVALVRQLLLWHGSQLICIVALLLGTNMFDGLSLLFPPGLSPFLWLSP